jgi:hypothetical protein
MADEAKDTRDPLDELIEVGTRMKRDKARMLELCQRLIGGVEAVREAVIEVSRPARRGGRHKKPSDPVAPDAAGGDAVIKTGGMPKLPGVPEYQKKVTCPVCGKEKGSRVHQERRYPVLHKNEETGETCKGSFQAVSEER